MSSEWSEDLFDAVDGTPLFARQRGKGSPAFVLSDGIACDGFAWKHLGTYFAERSRVVHWHYPGHGRSGRPRKEDSMTMPSLAQSLIGILEKLGIEEIILVGHSMGTQVALEAARRYPKEVKGLVLMCGSEGHMTRTFHGNDRLHRFLPGMRNLLSEHSALGRAVWNRISSPIAYRFASKAKEIDPERLSLEDFRHYWEHVRRLDPETYGTMLQYAGEHSAKDMLESCTIPTLVISAGKDTFTPPTYIKAMAEAMPNAQYVNVEGASHAAPVEQPDAFIRALDSYLARHALLD